MDSGDSGQRQTRKEVTRLAGVKSVHEAFEWFESHEREMADRQLEVTAIPAPPFRERQRSEWMLGKFIECGLQQAHMDAVCNVIGLLPGTAQGPFVRFRPTSIPCSPRPSWRCGATANAW